MRSSYWRMIWGLGSWPGPSSVVYWPCWSSPRGGNASLPCFSGWWIPVKLRQMQWHTNEKGYWGTSWSDWKDPNVEMLLVKYIQSPSPLAIQQALYTYLSWSFLSGPPHQAPSYTEIISRGCWLIQMRRCWLLNPLNFETGHTRRRYGYGKVLYGEMSPSNGITTTPFETVSNLSYHTWNTLPLFYRVHTPSFYICFLNAPRTCCCVGWLTQTCSVVAQPYWLLVAIRGSGWWNLPYHTVTLCITTKWFTMVK